MGRIRFSVLTPTVPGRLDLVVPLIRSLQDQIGSLPVEHLVLCDNKRRTIGSKRQALLEAAQGDYIAFVDDDDHVADDYVSCILREIAPLMTLSVPEDDSAESVRLEPKPDLVVFPIHVRINGDQDGIVEPSVRYAPPDGDITKLQPYAPPVTYRPPHELLVWRRSVALRGKFPDVSGGEDFLWARQVWPLVQVERRIDKVLYYYETSIDRREH